MKYLHQILGRLIIVYQVSRRVNIVAWSCCIPDVVESPRWTGPVESCCIPDVVESTWWSGPVVYQVSPSHPGGLVLLSPVVYQASPSHPGGLVLLSPVVCQVSQSQPVCPSLVLYNRIIQLCHPYILHNRPDFTLHICHNNNVYNNSDQYCYNITMEPPDYTICLW